MMEEERNPETGTDVPLTEIVPMDHVHQWHRRGNLMRCACGAGYEAAE